MLKKTQFCLGNCIFCAIFLIILLGIINFIFPFEDTAIAQRIITKYKVISPSEKNILEQLMKSKNVFFETDVFDRIVSFYENIISFLLGLMALCGIFGFFYIRNSHKIDIEDGIESKLSHQSTKEIIIKPIVESQLSLSVNDGDLREELDNLKNRLEFLEKAINEKSASLTFEEESEDA